jgi:hypothetical protein
MILKHRTYPPDELTYPPDEFVRLREPHTPGRLFYVLWKDGSENILITLTMKLCLSKTEKLLEQRVYEEQHCAVAGTGLAPLRCGCWTAHLIAWDRAQEVKIITVKDLPLYVSWDEKSSIFEALIKGEEVLI